MPLVPRIAELNAIEGRRLPLFGVYIRPIVQPQLALQALVVAVAENMRANRLIELAILVPPSAPALLPVCLVALHVKVGKRRLASLSDIGHKMYGIGRNETMRLCVGYLHSIALAKLKSDIGTKGGMGVVCLIHIEGHLALWRQRR